MLHFGDLVLLPTFSSYFPLEDSRHKDDFLGIGLSLLAIDIMRAGEDESIGDGKGRAVGHGGHNALAVPISLENPHGLEKHQVF